ncbi:MAG: OsmC family protein [Novosphingobium sp.]|nr:OsmC family protein [Novosphingobium sp.]
MPGTEEGLIVRTEHLTDEMLLIDVGHTTIVSDHPEHMGGHGKGPTPGELVKGALAASAALEIGRMIERDGLAVESLGVACSTGFETVRRDEGPMPSTTMLDNFQLHVALVGNLDADQVSAIENAAGNCAVARALSAGIGIEERDTFKQEPAKRASRATSHLIEQMYANRPAPGEKVVQPVNTQTAVKAEYLGDGRALLKWSKTVYLAEEKREEGQVPNGAQPELLLLAGLSACTSVFVARAAAMVGADAEVRVVSTGVIDPASDRVRIVKTLEVTGELSEDQKHTLAYFGDNCAIGETLRRKARIAVTVDLIEPAGGAGVGAVLSAMGTDARKIDSHFEEIVCDDGSCCVPDLDVPASPEADRAS